MSEVYTYQELRELALKHGIRDNKVHIGVWLQTQGYQKQRIQINHIRKTFYLKFHDWDKNPNSTWHKYHPYRWNNRAYYSSQSNNQNRQRLFKKEIPRTIRATGKNKAATLLQEEIISTQKNRSWAHLYSLAAIFVFNWVVDYFIRQNLYNGLICRHWHIFQCLILQVQY